MKSDIDTEHSNPSYHQFLGKIQNLSRFFSKWERQVYVSRYDISAEYNSYVAAKWALTVSSQVPFPCKKEGHMLVKHEHHVISDNVPVGICHKTLQSGCIIKNYFIYILILCGTVGPVFDNHTRKTREIIRRGEQNSMGSDIRLHIIYPWSVNQGLDRCYIMSSYQRSHPANTSKPISQGWGVITMITSSGVPFFYTTLSVSEHKIMHWMTKKIVPYSS